MDEKAAWQCFLKTGKVADYLLYTKARTGATAEMKKEASDEHKDGRIDNQRADCGGK